MATETIQQAQTLADVLDRLGNVAPARIRFRPFPGTATENDVVQARKASERLLCELVDSVLIEKTRGTREALLAGLLVHYLWSYLDDNDLGVALGAHGMLRLWRGCVRIPDAAFIAWDKLPEGSLPDMPIAPVAPDLAAEILSDNNTRGEIERKIDDYLRSGCRLVWVIDPTTRTADVHSPDKKVLKIAANQSLDGGDVLPGFRLPLKQLFERTRRKKRR